LTKFFRAISTAKYEESHSVFMAPPPNFSHFPDGVFFDCAYKEVSSRLKMSFEAYWVMIGFTCSHHFSAESTPVEVPSLITDCHVMFQLFLNGCSHQLEHTKFMPIFRVILTALFLTTGHPLQTSSSEHVKTIQTLTSLSVSPCCAL
jgi:hypothetical protein